MCFQRFEYKYPEQLYLHKLILETITNVSQHMSA